MQLLKFLTVWWVLLIGALACNPIASLTSPAAILVFAPDPTIEVSDEVLEESRAIIQQRLDSALTGTATVQVENHQISVAVFDADEVALATQLATEPGALIFFDSDVAYTVGDAVPNTAIALLTEADIEMATAEKTDLGWYVTITFTEDGKGKLAEYTQANIGRYLVIVRDGVVLLAPVINAPITEGQAVISGNFDEAEARVLAAQIDSGLLTIPLELIETK